MSNVIDMSAAPEPRKERPTTALTVADATPMQMLAIAVQQGADIAKLEKLMELQERWERNQGRKAFEAAVAEAKSELKPILKSREVDFTGNTGKRTNYWYEDFAQIATQVDPVLSKHGLSYRHRAQQNAKTLTVTCILAHRDGHHEETTLSADNDESGNKNSIQSVGSAATYLQRYTLKLALGLAAAKDNDARGATKKPTLSSDQIANLEALISEVGTNKVNFLKWARAEALEDILMSNYTACVQALESKRKG